MESVLPPPPPFTFLSNLENITAENISKDWEKWKNSFEIYFAACELAKKDPKVQINILLHLIGEQGREVYEQFNDTFTDLKSLLVKFDSFFLSRKNITVQRHCFFTRDQKDGESIDQYSFELKKLASKCEFKDLCDDLVRDRLICGITNSEMRERLLREPNLTLSKSIEICNIAQMSRMQAGTIKKELSEQHAYYIGNGSAQGSGEDVDDVHFVSRRGAASGGRGRGVWRGARSARPPSAHPVPAKRSPGSAFRRPYGQRNNGYDSRAACQMCGGVHGSQRCPAYGKRCLRCNRYNHFSRMCRVFELCTEEENPDQRTDSPVKDMKKKMAANAEKEKNAAESTPSKSEKPAEKPADKTSDKPADKTPVKPAEKTSDKPADKPADKAKADKPADKQKEKAPEKPAEKNKAAEKKDGPSEKKKEETGKGDSTAKTEKTGKAKQNGSSNGMNGTAHASSDSELLEEGDETELFPELAYDDSDVEWESGQDNTRSLTRRSQVKATRTPETPRPASDKTEDESKESKVLKLSQEPAKDTTKSDKKTDAKSDKKSDAKSDTKPDAKKSDAKSDTKSDAKKSDAKQDGVQETPKADAKKEVKESPKKDDKKDDKSEKVEFEVVVEIENSADTSEESRKPDTNFSKSRVKVSPYRRSMRLADQTTSSIAANYTGNNTTMEMDITESSSFMDESMDDSYLSGLRSIKGRRSYKPLKEMALRNTGANRSARSVTSTIVSEQCTRPTAPVVGRKRKPEPEDNISAASEAEEAPLGGKRQRLLERLARPFRRTTLLPARRNAEIVGINTDLPLTAPVASTSSFDPETLKTAPADPVVVPSVVAATPLAEDSKRCVIM